MRRFLRKIAIYFIVILSVTIFLWRWMALQPNNYSRLSHEINLQRQLDRIREIHEPKIIFIGGSGCAFGLYSPMLYDYYQMPIVNTGTHAGLGLRLQISLFMPYISENDIVVLIPEYAQFFGDFYLGNNTVFRIFSTSYDEGYQFLNVRQQLHLFKYAPLAYRDARLARPLKELAPNSPYSAEALNEYGDVERYDFRIHKKIKVGDGDLDKNLPIQQNAVKLLCDFYQFCQAGGATMIILPPALRDEAFEQNKEQIIELWETLSSHGLPIVSSPKNYVLPDSLFFDTDYHLTYEGVILRSNKLISDIDSACFP